MVAVRELGGERTSAAAATPLALGFALMGALVTGEVLRRFQLPRLTGYLLFGVIVGPYVSNLITAPMAAQLQVFTGIATTLKVTAKSAVANMMMASAACDVFNRTASTPPNMLNRLPRSSAATFAAVPCSRRTSPSRILIRLSFRAMV